MFWTCPFNTSLIFFALALVIGPIGTSNGSLAWLRLVLGWSASSPFSSKGFHLESSRTSNRATIQFYGNSHNSQSDRCIELKFYVESPDMVSYLGLNFQLNQSSGRHRSMGQQRLYEFCYLLHFDLWTSYLARILFVKGCGSLFWEYPNSSKIFNGLQHSFHVWQRFINVSESFSYKDSIFILATKRKEDFRFNSPGLYGTSEGQQIWSYHI